MGRIVVSGNAGKMGRSFIDGNEYANTEYEYTEIAEEEEVTNSSSAGKNEYEYGNTHIEGSFSADWDAQQNPHVGPPSLTAGGRYTYKGYISSPPGLGNEAGPHLEMDLMVINNLRVTIPAKGKVNYSFDFKSSGDYTLPVGETASSSSGA